MSMFALGTERAKSSVGCGEQEVAGRSNMCAVEKGVGVHGIGE